MKKKTLIEEHTYSTTPVKGADREQITDLILAPAEKHIKEFVIRNSALLISRQGKREGDLFRLNPVDSDSWIDDNIGEYPFKFKVLENKNDHMIGRLVYPFISESSGAGMVTKPNDQNDSENLLVCVVRRDESDPYPEFKTMITWSEESGGLTASMTIRMALIQRWAFQIGWRGL